MSRAFSTAKHAKPHFYLVTDDVTVDVNRYVIGPFCASLAAPAVYGTLGFFEHEIYLLEEWCRISYTAFGPFSSV
jgi:hypothetical protein